MKYGSLIIAMGLLLALQGSAVAISIRDVTFSTESAGNVVFSHTVHLQKKGMRNNCRSCHDVLYNLRKKKTFTMADMNKGKSCGFCHNGISAFPLKQCENCHQTREIRYRVAATGDIWFSHKVHLKNDSDCKKCHPQLYRTEKNSRQTMASMNKGKSCGFCHNGTNAFSVKDCLRCHPVRELVFEEKTTGNVKFSHTNHLKTSTCTDCHPSVFRTERSKSRVSMQDMESGRSCGACHDGQSAFSVKEKCEDCHQL